MSRTADERHWHVVYTAKLKDGSIARVGHLVNADGLDAFLAGEGDACAVDEWEAEDGICDTHAGWIAKHVPERFGVICVVKDPDGQKVRSEYIRRTIEDMTEQQRMSAKPSEETPEPALRRVSIADLEAELSRRQKL